MSLIARLLSHPALHAVLGCGLFLFLYGATGGAATAWPPLRGTPGQLLVTLAGAAAGIAGYGWFERVVERRREAAFALPGAGRELAGGLLLGAGLFSLAVALVALLGGLAIEGVRGIGELWGMAAMAVASGVYEELVFRGILFRQIERWLGSGVALALTAAFFGTAHLLNPDATWFAALAIAFEAGILLGAAYMLTRRLWLAVGIHAAWNFTQGWVFSVPVSGGRAPAGLLQVTRHGPDWLTGGAFGLEASAVAMVVATGAGIAMLALARRRGAFMPPAWRR
ncbi:MAG: CPBP family intramembrane metalloprotease [Sphingomonadales bacterium]|nr:CPBP family intramembrane metalloprotease [Sphingomonadales bacterium]